MANRRARNGCLAALLLVALALGGGFLWLRGRVAPAPPGPEVTFRIPARTPLNTVLADLERRGVLRDAQAAGLYARFVRRDQRPVAEGTYRVRPGAEIDQVLGSLRRPLRQMVRLPEGWWIARTAKRLEEKGVCTADEYIALANRPEEFKADVRFPLPTGRSLEGYLFPDTYDLPPLLGARETIRRQLQAFERKVVTRLPKEIDLHRTLTIASMVEGEAALDSERRRVAGVIENRLRIGMRLQIDATVLYALQEWMQLPPGVVNTVDSPYNTYRIGGLPPGPIGSPSVESVLATLEPEEHSYLYYVAMPDRSHLFSRDYATHLRNIRTSRRAFAEAGR